MAGSKNVLASSAMSASYNMVLQVMFRVMTFLLNAFVLRNRYVTEDMLGVVNVRLTLLYSTVLFVAREAFRRACLSQKENHRWQQTINLIWCSVPLGVMAASVLCFVWSNLLEVPDPEVIPHYHLAVVIFASCAVLELLAEPLWVLGQALLFVRLKVLIEGSAIAGRCILTVVLVVFFPHLGILSFCIAQLCFTIIFVGLYYLFFVQYIASSAKKDDDFPLGRIRDFFPKRIENEHWTSSELYLLTWSFFKQGFLKQLLTEGERYVMTLFNVLSFANQGIYDTVNNLGSLAARFIFQPIEESGYLFFAQTLTRDVPVSRQPKDSISLASSVLQCLLKVVVLIGTTIWVFGDAYSYLLLDIYAGSLLSSEPGPTLLKWFSFYVLLLAVNGTTECFVFAAMSLDQVNSPNWRCDCKITYACSSESFGVVEDLAPNDYPLRITGMRWRQKQSSQEEFCKDQCRGRMNAFLAPNDDGSFSEYSFAAICLDLLNVPGSPFLQNSGAPCCTMYLEYGRQWCEENWDVSLFTARCLQLGSPDFSGGAPAVTASHAFGIDGSCQPGFTDFNWCDTGTLACPSP